MTATTVRPAIATRPGLGHDGALATADQAIAPRRGGRCITGRDPNIAHASASPQAAATAALSRTRPQRRPKPSPWPRPRPTAAGSGRRSAAKPAELVVGGKGEDRIQLGEHVVAVGGEGADTFDPRRCPPPDRPARCSWA